MKFPQEGVYFLFNPRRWKKSPWEKHLPALFPCLSALQLRSPEMRKNEIKKIAFKLKRILAPAQIPLIINNYPRIALSAGAGGVHLGSGDMPIEEARKFFSGIIGASRHTAAGARRAQKAGASYIGAGPVFPTGTKDTRRDCLGPEGFKKIKESVKIPVLPVGGINPFNRRRLDGITDIVAVSSAINSSMRPAGSARALLPAEKQV